MTAVDQSPNDKKRRKPIFGIISLLVALAAAAVSLSVYFSGRDTGFEGFGAMLVGVAIGAVGLLFVLVPALISKARREMPGWLPFLSITIAVLSLLILVLS